MTAIQQELMTPQEAARWFRRSPSWIRQQSRLLRIGGPGGQPLYHTQVCRAYVLGRICRLPDDALRRVQVEALAAACGVVNQDLLLRILDNAVDALDAPAAPDDGRPSAAAD